MNKRLIIFGALGIIAVIAVSYAIIPKQSNQMPDNNLVYCSSEGTLTDTMPIQSHRSYCLKSDSRSREYLPDVPSKYSFSIVDDQGNTVKDFETTHTERMHVIVVRYDLFHFEHIHPAFDPSSGRFTFTDLTFPTFGEYRIFADFAPAGVMHDPMGMPLMVTLSEDIKVGNTYKPQPLGTEERTKTFDGYQVTLTTHGDLVSGSENMLMFSISANGKPVTNLQEYLGALGHSVILKEGTLDYIHTHAIERTSQNGTVSFMAYFPEPGKYKAFTQFQRAGKVFTTDFVISVTKGSGSVNQMPNAPH